MLLLTASPARAVADAGVATADGPVPWTLTAECSVVAGATTNLEEIRFVIKASAHAEGPAFATQVSCTVYNSEDGSELGGCNGGLVGPLAACVGTVDVPIGVVPSTCVTATALYATGIAAMDPCP
ncbi:MAG TPA: hypothetical protein VHN37_06185 [Actinomycetota bacterium]|nr:hypothetical protein [Actinomycetota bacterium]